MSDKITLDLAMQALQGGFHLCTAEERALLAHIEALESRLKEAERLLRAQVKNWPVTEIDAFLEDSGLGALPGPE